MPPQWPIWKMLIKSIKCLTGEGEGVLLGSGQRKYRETLFQMVQPRLSSKHGFLSTLSCFWHRSRFKVMKEIFTPSSRLLRVYCVFVTPHICVQMWNWGRVLQQLTRLSTTHTRLELYPHICAAARISLLPPTSICCRQRMPICTNSPTISCLPRVEPHPQITSPPCVRSWRQTQPPLRRQARFTEPEGLVLSVLQRQSVRTVSEQRKRVAVAMAIVLRSTKPASDWLQPQLREEDSAN